MFYLGRLTAVDHCSIAVRVLSSDGIVTTANRLIDLPDTLLYTQCRER